MDKPTVLTPEEVAKELRLSRAKVYELLGRGAIRSIKIDTSRRVRRQDLDAYLEQLANQAG